jgi:hypothetical protein
MKKLYTKAQIREMILAGKINSVIVKETKEPVFVKMVDAPFFLDGDEIDRKTFSRKFSNNLVFRFINKHKQGIVYRKNTIQISLN